MFSFRFPRYRTSSFSSSARTAPAPDSIMGTTTSVAYLAGIPSRKSIFGSVSGGRSETTSALTIWIDSSLRGNSASATSATIAVSTPGACMPLSQPSPQASAVNAAVTPVRAPR